MKKFLLSILGVLISLPAFAVDFTYTYQGKTLKYTVIDDNSRTCMTKDADFTGTSGNNVSGDLIIPEQAIYDGKEYTVTTIGFNSFYKCSGLTSVEFPSTIINFKRSAFKDCTGLTSLVLPQNASIGTGAFEGCTGLTSLIIPQNVSVIDSYAFDDCTGLKTVIITGSSTNIHSYGAFNRCTGLIKAAYPDNIANPFPGSCSAIPFPANSIIEDGIIYGPEKKSVLYAPLDLETFAIPESVTTIGNFAFQGCSKLKSDLDFSRITTVGNSAFRDCSGVASALDLTSAVTIGSSAFYGCSGLTSVNTGDDLTDINESAFHGCSGLTSVELGKSVASIGNMAFADCPNIQYISSFAQVPPTIADDTFHDIYDTANVIVADGAYLATNWSLFKNIFVYFYDGALNYILKPAKEDGAENLATVYPGDYSKLTEVTIPYRISVEQKDGSYIRYIVDGIDKNTFKDCSQLKIVSFHNRSTVKFIGEYAFAGSGITSISIPATVDSISDYAFYNTASLNEIELKEGLTTIGECAFSLSGTDEASIIVPSTVTAIGTDAFKDFKCSKVDIADIPAWCNIDFANVYANPLKSGSLYLNDTKLTDLIISNSTPAIKNYAFYNASAITSVTLGNGLKSIGDQAFSGCTGVSAVTLPPSVETIGASAFAGNSNLTTIAMGHSVKSIGEMAFDGCPATTVSITAQTPPSASNNTFSRYTGKFYVQGQKASDAYFDAYTCWDRFDPELLTEPTGIDISSKTIEGKPGDTFRLTATLQPQNVSLPQIFWSSSNPEIATVDENGLVTIHQTPAEATLAAEGQEAASCKITAESLYADGPVAVVEVVDKIAGIDDVTTDSEDGIDFSAPLEIFTMQGMAAGRDINRLSKGIYIVRQGSTVRKIVIK